MNWNFWRVGAVLALLVVVLTSPAQAQSWPTRAVKFIVPFGPGAGADIGARLFAGGSRSLSKTSRAATASLPSKPTSAPTTIMS